jgi:hypothetical protein
MYKKLDRLEFLIKSYIIISIIALGVSLALKSIISTGLIIIFCVIPIGIMAQKYNDLLDEYNNRRSEQP